MLLEIIALIFLARRIGIKAIQKGQPKGRWQVYLVLAWFGFEIIGAVAGILISRDLILATLLAWATAVGGYLLVDHRLNQIPDQFNEDTRNQIGPE